IGTPTSPHEVRPVLKRVDASCSQGFPETCGAGFDLTTRSIFEDRCRQFFYRLVTLLEEFATRRIRESPCGERYGGGYSHRCSPPGIMCHDLNLHMEGESDMRVITAALLSGIIVGLMGASAFADQETDVVALVDKAVESFKEKGTDYTFRLINTTRGPFMKGELYVLAMDLEGNMLAHAANRDLVGKNQTGFKDGKGNLIFPAMRDVATSSVGKGWTEYWWVRHGEKEPTLKRTYIRRIPGLDVLVGAGYYVK
ncbi:MAG: cache domain-containing protein, partial [Pseudomonadota bacterium]